MSPYLFVVAALLAVLPILLIFKISIESIKENPNDYMKVQQRFFIWVAVAEIIPILLIIYGFSNMDTVYPIEELLLPGIIVLFTIGFASLFIFLQRIIDVNEESRGIIQQFVMLSIALVNAIPLISIVSLFLMME